MQKYKSTIVVLFFCFLLCSCSVNITEDFNYLKASSWVSVTGSIENCDQMEGGMVINGHIYYSLINHKKDDTNKESYIFEYDLDGNFIRHSKELHVGHSNDFTYVPEMDAIAIAHADESKLMTFVSIDNLEVIEVRPINDLPRFRAIEYIGDNNYVFSNGNTCYVAHYDEKFNITNTFEYEFDYDSGITQGLCSDGKYVFDLRSKNNIGNKNVIVKHDIETSEFIKEIEIKDISGEAEWISIYNGKFYIGTDSPYRIYTLKAYK